MLNNFDKNKNPFKVPENYFEHFNSRIMDQLSDKKECNPVVVPLWKKVLPWTAVAAALFGILFSVGLFDKTNVNDKVLAEQKNGNTESVSTYSSADEEEDYYLFLQDEVRKSQFKEMYYNY
ncbi:MAG: hypothetical protein LBI60_06350, partial [Bacteroidales bacterium]|nr:hypothetical protein [Bacteroidales bacterium]